MSSETEIAVRDGNFFVIENEKDKPRTEGQRKLLAYMHKQITLGNTANNLDIEKIYLKYGKQKKGEWVFIRGKKTYASQELARLHYPNDRLMSDYWGEIGPCYYKEFKVDDWRVKDGAKNWLNRNIGTLVKDGFLIVIPKGYILQRIEESKKVKTTIKSK